MSVVKSSPFVGEPHDRKAKLDGAFETSMDTIRNSVSFPYNWEFVFSIVLVAAILEQVVDLFGCIRQLLVQPQEIFFGYEVAY